MVPVVVIDESQSGNALELSIHKNVNGCSPSAVLVYAQGPVDVFYSGVSGDTTGLTAGDVPHRILIKMTERCSRYRPDWGKDRPGVGIGPGSRLSCGGTAASCGLQGKNGKYEDYYQRTCVFESHNRISFFRFILAVV